MDHCDCVCVCVWLNTYRGVFRAGGYDVFKEGIPLDVQHVSLMAAHLWVVGVQSARLEQRHKQINVYSSASKKSKTTPIQKDGRISPKQ